MKKWIINRTHELYKGRIFALKDKSCFHPEKNVTHDFYVLETFDWINVVALTSDNRFIMVKQHRLGTNEITIETPGGIIENNESAEECARRELEEETGYQAKHITLLKKLAVNPAILDNYVYFFLATGCEQSGKQQFDNAEDIEIEAFSCEKLVELIQTGIIDHSIAITALSLYFMSKHNQFPGVII